MIALLMPDEFPSTSEPSANLIAWIQLIADYAQAIDGL